MDKVFFKLKKTIKNFINPTSMDNCFGILKNQNLPDGVTFQRNLREEWDRDIITITPYLKLEHIEELASSFNKPLSTFQKYLTEQEKKERLVWVAFYDNKIAGYVTLQFKSHYKPFAEKNIPEIVDLNVLPDFRNKGIASELLTLAENAANSKIIGIGVGLYPDYGSAQRIYIKRGYIPDGCGITYNGEQLKPGTKTILDDDLILWLTKEIR